MSNIKLNARVYPLDESKSSTLAFASVSVDDLVAIRGIRIVDSEKGKFVTMPQSKDKSDEYHDIAFPINSDLRKEINKLLLDEYKTVAALAPEQRGYETPDKDSVRDINAETINLSVRVYPLDDAKGNLVAFANVGIEDLVAINGIRVVDSEKGLFVSMPQSKDKNDEYHDIAFPVNGDLRKEINKAVLAAYDKEISVDRKQSVGERLSEGAQKAAQYAAQPRDAAAKRAPGLGD